MDTKLMLTIEKEVVQVAMDYAKEKGQSLSELVENYFKLLANKRRLIKSDELSPRIKRLKGIIKVDKDLDYKQILTKELLKKYIK